MSDNREERFLQEIVAHPDDDLRRRALADWLDDGRPDDGGRPRPDLTPEREQADRDRAEFIRVQLGLYRSCDEYGVPLTDANQEASIRVLLPRNDELLSAHYEEWSRPLTDLGATRVEFRRGLPHHIDITAGHFLANAGRIFELVPIQSITITNVQGPEQMQALASSPHLGNLQTLDLWGNNLGPQGAAALAASPHVGNLTTLELSANDIGEAGAVALAASPHLTKLTGLYLSDNGLGNAGAAALARSPNLDRLTVLNLGYNDIGPDGARALATSPNLGSMNRLHLSWNGIGAEGAVALAASPHLGNLKRLDLSWNGIDADGAVTLTAALQNPEHLPRLNVLDMVGNAGATPETMASVQAAVTSRQQRPRGSGG